MKGRERHEIYSHFAFRTSPGSKKILPSKSNLHRIDFGRVEKFSDLKRWSQEHCPNPDGIFFTKKKSMVNQLDQGFCCTHIFRRRKNYGVLTAWFWLAWDGGRLEAGGGQKKKVTLL